MTAVIYLSNNWNWSGGFLQYLKWNGLIPDSAFDKDIPWSELGEYTSMFYDCEKCKADYLNQVKYIIGHANSINHKKYSKSPLLWPGKLPMNPGPWRRHAVNSYKKFIKQYCGISLKNLIPITWLQQARKDI